MITKKVQGDNEGSGVIQRRLPRERKREAEVERSSLRQKTRTREV